MAVLDPTTHAVNALPAASEASVEANEEICKVPSPVQLVTETVAEVELTDAIVTEHKFVAVPPKVALLEVVFKVMALSKFTVQTKVALDLPIEGEGPVTEEIVGAVLSTECISWSIFP